MATLERRIEKLEAVLLTVRLDHMTDDELAAHIETLPRGSGKRLEAFVALILRRPSAYPVVESDPAYDENWLDFDAEP
ncbi:MAG: hypothetical protein KBF98_16465 [Rhodoferax sp.]|nr:hypothetical protein [Rhodoferax sp.]